MNKLLLIVIAVILLLGGGLYFYNNSRSGTDNSSGAPSDTTSTTEEDTGSGATSLKNLLGMGKNLECTFSSDEITSGTVYVAGERVRGDFTVEGMTSSMIQDGGWTYFWGSAFPQGIKMKLDLDQTTPTETTPTTPAASQALDLEAEMNFDCDSWRVDSSKFELPAGVEFMDFSQQTQDLMNQYSY